MTSAVMSSQSAVEESSAGALSEDVSAAGSRHSAKKRWNQQRATVQPADVIVGVRSSIRSSLLIPSFFALCLDPTADTSSLSAPAELSSTADCDDITADVIIADSRSCASSQLLIVMTSSLLLIASSRIYADVITTDSQFLSISNADDRALAALPKAIAFGKAASARSYNWYQIQALENRAKKNQIWDGQLRSGTVNSDLGQSTVNSDLGQSTVKSDLDSQLRSAQQSTQIWTVNSQLRSGQSTVNSDMDSRQLRSEKFKSQLSSRLVNAALYWSTQLWTGQHSFGLVNSDLDGQLSLDQVNSDLATQIKIWRCKFRFGDVNSDLATHI
ncbi:hypothetical protein F511_01672 [Dorcoceras hygrometricum]|uniref:Uncharacterized protein n=1 Tax=Dorcoceras hygrometricum TaxID=472368 RepID=A0A2Z7A5I9_9LAMI|nr:hypothetical protein F511_01672 [Dorcoceras hygrometricum]